LQLLLQVLPLHIVELWEVDGWSLSQSSELGLGGRGGCGGVTGLTLLDPRRRSALVFLHNVAGPRDDDLFVSRAQRSHTADHGGVTTTSLQLPLDVLAISTRRERERLGLLELGSTRR
jgi:hypothetical protein